MVPWLGDDYPQERSHTPTLVHALQGRGHSVYVVLRQRLARLLDSGVFASTGGGAPMTCEQL